MKKKILLLSSIVLWTLFSNFCYSQTVTRGPYLQLGTPESIVVRWRTDTSTDSRVTVGGAPGSLLTIFDVPGDTTEHEVLVDGLMPNTRYFYAIGSSDSVLAGDDSTHFFVTSPEAGNSKLTRIWVLGDSGSKDDRPRAVRDAYNNFTGSRHTDLWLMLGDNAYQNGSQSDHQKAIFENMFEEMLRKSVLWPSIGNHDVDTPSTPGPYPYMDIFTLPTNAEAGGVASGTEEYYSFDYGDIHFIILNSENDDLVELGSEMWTWLQQDIAANDKFWLFAYWHHPTYSKGTHDSDDESTLIDMRQRSLPVLESAGVDLVMMGHSHAYERSYLLNGHYGKSNTLADSMKIDSGDGKPDGDGAYIKNVAESSANKGTVYMVLGSSSWPQEGGSLDHPIMVTSQIELGSMVLDIDENVLEAKFLDAEGNIDDYFTMIKQGPPQISISPQVHNFGEVLVDSSQSQTFLIENTGISDLKVSNIIFTGGDSLEFTLENIILPDSIAPDASMQFQVGFQPHSSGTKFTTMRIESNGPNNSMLDVSLSGEATLPPPQISILPEFHDFGSVIIDSTRTKLFAVNNMGGSSLHLNQITLTGADSLQFYIDTPTLPDTLAPDSSVVLRVTFNPNAEGNKSTVLQILSNDPVKDTLNVSLSGAGLRPPQISITPEAFDFGEVLIGSTKPQVFVVKNIGGSLLSFSWSSFPGSQFFEFNTEIIELPDSLQADSSFQFIISFAPLSSGVKSDTLLIESNDPANNKLEVILTGTGVALPPQFSVSPDNYDFGEVLVDSSKSKIFEVKNTGGSPLILKQAVITGGDSLNFNIENITLPDTLQPESSVQFSIVFTPSSANSKSATLLIKTNDPALDTVLVNLAGTGIALPPKISVSPNNYDFGEVFVDSSKSKIFEVKNNGGSPLILKQAVITGGDSLHFNFENITMPDTLQPDSSVQFNIVFTPSSANSNSATLLIETNDPALDTVLVNLAGTGIALPPKISVSSAFYNFGEVKIDSTQSQIFTVRNTGGSALEIVDIEILGNDSGSFGMDSLNVPLIIAVEDSQNISVNFTPQTEGEFTATISIEHNDTTQNQIGIILEGIGIPPTIVGTSGSGQDILPNKISLSPNYPNPFNNETKIVYAIPKAATVRIFIYNVMGQKIRVLVDEFQQPGYKHVSWNGRDNSGGLVVSGVYFCEMKVGNTRIVQKILLQK